MRFTCRPGDLVRLKSGGPAMTLHSQAEEAEAWLAVWFCGEEMRSGTFSTAMLEPLDPLGTELGIGEIMQPAPIGIGDLAGYTSIRI